jgi:hypothetical protein
MKAKALLIAIALATSAISALAQTLPAPVTNISKKGSLLIFPLVNIDPGARADTIIELSNDQTTSVHVECYYVNEQKGTVGFGFDISGKATVSWDILTLAGDGVAPPPFPNYGDYPQFGSLHRGELVCFATDSGSTNQIAFNHLQGTGTVLGLGRALKYSPWAFQALNAQGLPEADNTIQGAPGVLLLTGGAVDACPINRIACTSAGTYDACPAYNTVSFMPNGSTLGNLVTASNYLAIASCNQDLRQDYILQTTKLLFTVWNSLGQSYSETYQCVDSVVFVPLVDGNTNLVNATNFDYKTLGVAGAQFIVQGAPSARCPVGTETAGLLGVAVSLVRTSGGTTEDLVASGTHEAGSTPGYVYWDAQRPAPFNKRKQ